MARSLCFMGFSWNTHSLDYSVLFSYLKHKLYPNFLIDKFYFNAKYICSFKAYGEMSFIKRIIKKVNDVASKVDL